MPDKGGKLTAQERVVVDKFVATGDEAYAMEKARYAHPVANRARVFARPAVQESIKAKQLARLNNELLPLALDTIEGILRNPKASDSNKLTATSQVLKHTAGAAGEGGADKEPHEMSADELQHRIDALRREAADRARPVIEAEASTIDDQSDVFG
jgi:hypothetical protein